VTFDALMDAGPIEHLNYGGVTIVEDIQAEEVVADLYTQGTFPYPQRVGPVAQDQNGVYYISISGFDSGHNVVAIRSLWFDRSDDIEGATWHTNVIAFDVTYPGESPEAQAP
jgi:hypothetical protein